MEEEAPTFEALLLGTNPATWRVGQVIVLGWSDGPIEGLCALRYPCGCFYFTMIAEQRYPETSSQRLFRVEQVPYATMDRVLDLLTPLGPIRTPVWVPLWRWSDDERQQEVEHAMEQLLTARTATSVLIQTADMEHFQNCWVSVRDE